MMGMPNGRTNAAISAQSPSAYTPAALVCNCRSTTIPRAVLRPACLANVRLGRRPIADNTQSAFHRAIGERDGKACRLALHPHRSHAETPLHARFFQGQLQ